jgi:hypothetical protein
MDKYDEAIEFLKGVEPGSYFDECAELMEELLAQLEAKKPKRQRQTEEELAWLKQAVFAQERLEGLRQSVCTSAVA